MGKVLSFGELEIEMSRWLEMWLRIRGQKCLFLHCPIQAVPAFIRHYLDGISRREQWDRGEGKLQKRGPL